MSTDRKQKSALDYHEHQRWLQVDFGGFLKPNSIEKAFANVFTRKTNISITNTGQTDLIFYFTTDYYKNEKSNISLKPGEVKIIKIKNLSHLIWNAMMVKNENPDKEGAYFIYISNKV